MSEWRHVRCSICATMRLIQICIATAFMCFTFTGARAESTATRAVDGEAARALDSVIEHVVAAPHVQRAKGVATGAKGEVTVQRTGTEKPVIRGTVVVGSEGSAGWHKRTIDWDFAKGTGTFESIRRDTTETEKLTVVASTAGDKRQVMTASGGPVERESVVETKTVQLVSGGTAPIVTAEDRVVVAKGSIPAFVSTGEATLLRGGYVKRDDASGARIYTRRVVEVGGRKVTDAELAAFMKNRVAKP